jgi:hypothetical protein
MDMSQQQFYDQVMMEQHQKELQQPEQKMNYKELRKINVSDHIEKKNGLSYLSWAWAVDTLLQQDPTATWTYGEPKQFGDTLMVFCSVTAFGKIMTAQLPVLDYRNKAIINPDAMAVNTAMQRCLAKAIALHGIGLYIYSGEDIPESEKVEEVITEKDIELAKVGLYTANNDGKLKEAFFKLTPQMQDKLRDYANELKKAA